jgi:hypothetical protein
MDYHHPFFSSEDISIPIPNPGQHPSAPVEMLRRENYHRNSIMAVSSYAQPPSISPVEDTEELDTSSRPRLTQEQIATLEENFRQRPKPGTDFKKHLASQIGLSIQRVNVSGGVDSRAGCMLTIITELVSKPSCQSKASEASGEKL